MEIMGTALFNIIAMLVTLGILVTIHEYGHFWVARRCGVKVERFSVGFGKPILRWRGKLHATDKIHSVSGAAGTLENADLSQDQGTEYVIGILPLGGYVKMLGEQDKQVSPEFHDRAFNCKPLSSKAAIVAAGPIANFLLAIVLYWIMFMGGVSGLAPVIGSVESGTLAAAAGLQAGDEIVAVDGQATQTWQDVRINLLDRLGESGSLVFTVQNADSNTQRNKTLQLQNWLANAEEPQIVSSLGITPFHQVIPARIGELLPEGRAAAAGFESGDLVVGVNGEPLEFWTQWLEVIRDNPETDLNVAVERNSTVLNLLLRPAYRLDEAGLPELDANGNEQGYIGAGVVVPELPESMFREINYSPLAAIPAALAETWNNSVFVLVSIKKMLAGLISVKNLSGPITIAQVAGQTASYGFEYYIGFLAVLSISLGVLNLLPIPVLDGGHLFYYAIEAIIRRPVPEKIQEWGMQAGIVLVAGIMFLALYNDVNRLF